VAESPSRRAEGLAAYRASQFLDQRPAAVLAAVHAELYRALASAMSAYERRALDEMCRHNVRATQILSGLSAAFEAAGAGVAMLHDFYGRIQSAVNGLLVDQSATETLQESLIQLRMMSTAFREEIFQNN
jgi:flagellin-specific chaperone FliS